MIPNDLYLLPSNHLHFCLFLLCAFASTYISVRGKSVPFDESERILTATDPRTRVECKVSHENCYLIGEFMIDDGAQNEMTLPPRKIFQLGLRPYSHLRNVSNLGKKAIRFDPPVSVEIKFLRGSDIEVRKEYLQAQCWLDELVGFLQSVVPAESVTHDNALSEYNRLMNSNYTLPTTSIPEPPDESFVPTSLVGLTLELTPVKHRPPQNPDQRVVLGVKGIVKFHCKIDPEHRALEIEEECELEE